VGRGASYLEEEDQSLELVLGQSWASDFIFWFIHSGHLYSASLSSLLISTHTVSKLTRRSATGNYEWRTCPRFPCGG